MTTPEQSDTWEACLRLKLLDTGFHDDIYPCRLSLPPYPLGNDVTPLFEFITAWGLRAEGVFTRTLIEVEVRLFDGSRNGRLTDWCQIAAWRRLP